MIPCKFITTLAFITFVGAASAQTPPPNPSLTPPGAPADGVFKTLDQVEARIPMNAQNTPGDGSSTFNITAPGSYYLTGDLVAASSKRGITITSGKVTLDLSGYTLDGKGLGLDGITITGTAAVPLHQVSITGGNLSAWDGDGIRIAFADARISGVSVSQCDGDGIRSGQGSVIVSRCESRYNGGSGVYVGGGAVVEHCTVRGNGGTGIFAGDTSAPRDGAIVRACYVAENAFLGIQVEEASLVTGNHLEQNALGGIFANARCEIIGNTIHDSRNASSPAAGIAVDTGLARVVIERNLIVDCDRGVKIVGTQCLVVGNRVGNTTIEFEIAAGNHVGEIVIAPLTTAAISGASGGGLGAAGAALETPFANLVY